MAQGQPERDIRSRATGRENAGQNRADQSRATQNRTAQNRADQHGAPATDGPPRWDLRVEPDGRLTAVLTGTNPPLTVSADDLISLRKQIKIIVMRALL